MIRCLLVVLALLWGQATFAQDAEPTPDAAPEAAAEPAAVSIPELDEELEELGAREVAYRTLETELASISDPEMASIVSARVDAMWADLADDKLDVAEAVAGRIAAGEDVEPYVVAIAESLEGFVDDSLRTIERLREGITFPTGEQTPAEFVVLDQQLLRSVEKFDGIYELLIRYTEVAEPLGLSATNYESGLNRQLQESAANRSVFLQLALDQVSVYRAAAKALPEDADIQARLAASEERVKSASDILQDIVGVMDELDLATEHYHQQLLTVTGELTTEVLNVGVLTGLAAQWGAATTEFLATEGPRLLFRLLLVIAIVYIFMRIGRASRAVVSKALASSKLRLSTLLRDMIVSSVKNLIILIGVLIALSQIGISLGPLLAGLGIAGFIIGFALQDTLSNFASGMMILFYRPFDVGDYVDAGGVAGTVSHMSLVNTTFKTIDNQLLIVPNNLVWAGVITNVTAQTTRRVDLVFGVSYSDDLKHVEEVLHDIIANTEAVLDDPEPMIKVHELADSSVNFIVRPWVKTDDYWPTYWELTRAVKDRFDQEGISIPFPQRDVHHHQSS